jgi:hypothetical protein
MNVFPTTFHRETNQPTNVTWSDFDHVIVNVNFDYSEVCILYGFFYYSKVCCFADSGIDCNIFYCDLWFWSLLDCDTLSDVCSVFWLLV